MPGQTDSTPTPWALRASHHASLPALRAQAGFHALRTQSQLNVGNCQPPLKEREVLTTDFGWKQNSSL